MSFIWHPCFCRLQTFVSALLFYGIFLLVDDVNTSCQTVKCTVCLYVRADFLSGNIIYINIIVCAVGYAFDTG